MTETIYKCDGCGKQATKEVWCKFSTLRHVYTPTEKSVEWELCEECNSHMLEVINNAVFSFA